MVDEYIKQFKANVCNNCDSNCDKGINISYWKNKVLLKCIDYKQKDRENSYEVSHIYKINDEEA